MPGSVNLFAGQLHAVAEERRLDRQEAEPDIDQRVPLAGGVGR